VAAGGGGCGAQAANVTNKANTTNRFIPSSRI
jgi:hypothetical protein